MHKNNPSCWTYPKYAWNILFRCMNYIGVSHRAHRKLFIPHIKDLWNIHWRQCITVRRDIIQEKFEITHHNKLAHPTLLDTTCLWHLYITFIRCANTSCWINAKRSFCCNNYTNMSSEVYGLQQRCVFNLCTCIRARTHAHTNVHSENLLRRFWKFQENPTS
jgi:hypothetical protein